MGGAEPSVGNVEARVELDRLARNRDRRVVLPGKIQRSRVSGVNDERERIELGRLSPLGDRFVETPLRGEQETAPLVRGRVARIDLDRATQLLLRRNEIPVVRPVDEAETGVRLREPLVEL